jgi:hypothetical protein
VDRGTGPEARDPVSGWVVVEAPAAAEQAVAEPAGAGVLVRLEVAAVPACGIRARPAAVVALLAAVGQERAEPALEARAVVAALVQVPVAQAESAEAAGVELVLERGRAQVVQAAVQVVVGTEVVGELALAALGQALVVV